MIENSEANEPTRSPAAFPAVPSSALLSLKQPRDSLRAGGDILPRSGKQCVCTSRRSRARISRSFWLLNMCTPARANCATRYRVCVLFLATRLGAAFSVATPKVLAMDVREHHGHQGSKMRIAYLHLRGAPRNQVTFSEVPANRAAWRAQIEGQRVAASGVSRSKLSRRVATSSSVEFSNFLSTRVA